MARAVRDGADVNGLDTDGNTPLHFVAGIRGELSSSPLCDHRIGVVQRFSKCRMATTDLVARGAQVDQANRWGETPLHFAAYTPKARAEGTAILISDLLRLGADPNRANKEGNTPLHVANLHGHDRHVVGVLIEHGAKVDVANDKGITPLMRAVEYGPDRGTVADLLLENGADPNRKNPEGDAPLHIAIKTGGDAGKPIVVRVLLAANADPCVRDASGNTPYHISSGAIRRALAEAGGFDRSSPDGPGCPSNAARVDQ